jgi:hypothetical protein
MSLSSVPYIFHAIEKWTASPMLSTYNCTPWRVSWAYPMHKNVVELFKGNPEGWVVREVG